MSRLEEIENNFYPYDGNFGLSPDQVKYLVEQAKRVEYLERVNKELAEGIEFNNKEYGKVIDENNRYKRALRKIGFHALFGSIDWKQEYHELKIIARQELEGKTK